MYCGDETGAFIGEVGYTSSKFGYGGEDIPKVVLTSSVSYDNNQKKIVASGLEYGPSHRPAPSLEIVHVYDHPSSWDDNAANTTISDHYLHSNCCISHWDAFKNLWKRHFWIYVSRIRKSGVATATNLSIVVLILYALLIQDLRLLPLKVVVVALPQRIGRKKK
jgi:hypothetical protein